MRTKLLLLMIMSMSLFACNQTASVPEMETPAGQNVETEVIGLPNPASVYCEEQGFTLEMREGEGSTYGVCLFPDDSECEEWAYFRGECAPGDSLALNVPTTSSETLLAEDGCQIYQNELLEYTFHYPADAEIEMGNDPLKAVIVTGPLVDNERWPMIYISHPDDREEFLPPDDVDLASWLIDHQLLPPADTSDQFPKTEMRQEDVQIAGETAVHTRFDRSPQSYAYDKYFFAHDGQLYSIVILHTGDHEDWKLYNHFLENFQF